VKKNDLFTKNNQRFLVWRSSHVRGLPHHDSLSIPHFHLNNSQSIYYLIAWSMHGILFYRGAWGKMFASLYASKMTVSIVRVHVFWNHVCLYIWQWHGKYDLPDNMNTRILIWLIYSCASNYVLRIFICLRMYTCFETTYFILSLNFFGPDICFEGCVSFSRFCRVWGLDSLKTSMILIDIL